MKAEVERLTELLAINRAIAASLDYDVIVDLIVDKARSLTNADACVLLLAESGKPAKVARSVCVSSTLTSSFDAPLDERINIALRDALELDADAQILAVPMVLRGSLRGVLAVIVRHRSVDHFIEQDEYLLSALADQAAMALATAAHRKELEAALEAAERERRWLAAVIEDSPVAVILIQGPAGEWITANPRAERLFGRRIVQPGGVLQYADQLFAADGTQLPLKELPSAVALGGATIARELVIRRPDGEMVPIFASSAPIRDGHGKLMGAIVLFEDISTLKDLQRQREEWISVVAHDLRQPVGSISLRAQLLSQWGEEETAEKIRSHGEHILASVGILERMIRDLLDVSLIEAHHLSLMRRPCAVLPMLQEIIARSPVTKRHKVLLAGEGVPSIDVDPGRIEQIVTNLLSNADQYGAPETEIDIVAQPRGQEVEITVKNRGPGMSSSAMTSLFRRFHRGQTAGAKGEGTGLGLYVCKGIVEAHGGRIWVESIPEQMTAFHFTVPVAETRAEAR